MQLASRFSFHRFGFATEEDLALVGRNDQRHLISLNDQVLRLTREDRWCNKATNNQPSTVLTACLLKRQDKFACYRNSQGQCGFLEQS